MSACDTCTRPGACCRNFYLDRASSARTALEAMCFLASHRYQTADKRTEIGLPFYPSSYDAEHRIWRFTCVELGTDGRCTIYPRRPLGPCVIFEPGTRDCLSAQRRETEPSP